MQPYFFPYIGYFQLINEVDVYVNLEHVNFMKRSYMVRNLLKNNTQINIPVLNGSQNKLCNEVYTMSDELWFNKFEKIINYLYKKEINYLSVLNEVIIPWKNTILNSNRQITISEFNLSSIKNICNYLNISKEFYSSQSITDRKKNEGLQDIVKHFNGNVYVNAIGGQKLYTKEDFKKNGIDLYFIKMGETEFDYPYNSILDLMFRYPKNKIINEINNYTLI